MLTKGEKINTVVYCSGLRIFPVKSCAVLYITEVKYISLTHRSLSYKFFCDLVIPAKAFFYLKGEL